MEKLLARLAIRKAEWAKARTESSNDFFFFKGAVEAVDEIEKEIKKLEQPAPVSEEGTVPNIPPAAAEGSGS